MTDIKQSTGDSSSADYKQISIIIDRCIVRLNFIKKPKGNILEEVKRTILAGAIKV